MGDENGVGAGSPLAAFVSSLHADLDTVDRAMWGIAEADLAPLTRSLGSAMDRLSSLLLGVVGEAESRDFPLR